jgi:hypothetical protein
MKLSKIQPATIAPAVAAVIKNIDTINILSELDNGRAVILDINVLDSTQKNPLSSRMRVTLWDANSTPPYGDPTIANWTETQAESRLLQILGVVA